MVARKNVFVCGEADCPVVLSSFSLEQFKGLVASHQATHAPGNEPEKPGRATKRVKEAS